MVFLVFTEQGEYEQYSRDLEGVFATKELADAFAVVIHGEVEEWDVLTSAPIPVKLYTWADHINPNGEIGTDGRRRDNWKSWAHQEGPTTSKVSLWTYKTSPSRYISVSGTNLEEVKAEHKRLVAEVREKQKADALEV